MKKSIKEISKIILILTISIIVNHATEKIIQEKNQQIIFSSCIMKLIEEKINKYQ